MDKLKKGKRKKRWICTRLGLKLSTRYAVKMKRSNWTYELISGTICKFDLIYKLNVVQAKC